MRRRLQRAWVVFGAAVMLGAMAVEAQRAPEETTAIVGGTVIDGNGGPPIVDATVVVTGKRIAAVGPRASVAVPPGARRYRCGRQVHHARVHRHQRAFVALRRHAERAVRDVCEVPATSGRDHARGRAAPFEAWHHHRSRQLWPAALADAGEGHHCHAASLSARACSWPGTSSGGAGPSR